MTFSLDLNLDDETLEDPWQPDLAEPNGPSVEAIQAANLLTDADSDAWDLCAEMVAVGECPETEPDRIAISSALRSLCDGCHLDLTSIEDLAEQLMCKASSCPSQSQMLARAVAGVPELVSIGVTSSSVALHAAKTASTSDSEDIASLIFWLDPSDSLQLLEYVLEHCERQRTLEVIALLRFKTANEDDNMSSLGVALRQAEALTLLRSTGKADLPLRIHPELSHGGSKGAMVREPVTSHELSTSRRDAAGDWIQLIGHVGYVREKQVKADGKSTILCEHGVFWCFCSSPFLGWHVKCSGCDCLKRARVYEYIIHTYLAM